MKASLQNVSNLTRWSTVLRLDLKPHCTLVSNLWDSRYQTSLRLMVPWFYRCHARDTWLIYSGNMYGITWLTLVTTPRATNSNGIQQCLVLAKVNKTKFVGSWAWRDQPIDQVGPFLTSRLHELQAEVVYCQWQCTRLQTLTITQPPGSHRPLHGLHLTANKVPHTRSCVGIGHSQRECSPLYRGEVPTHRGVIF